MATNPSSDIKQTTDALSAANDVDGITGSTREILPDHLRAPDGITQDIHEINILLTAIIVNAQADFRWLNRKSPDAAAARKTTSRLVAQVQQLQVIVGTLDRVGDV